jgi:hypothetical protein
MALAIANAMGWEHLEPETLTPGVNLWQARRIETVSAFASGAAHNFNNIVGAIPRWPTSAVRRRCWQPASWRLCIDLSSVCVGLLPDKLPNFNRQTTAVTPFSPTEIMP